jgi:hypothetical protein
VKNYRRIFYDKTTGNKIIESGFEGDFVATTIEQDIETFAALSERNRDTFDVLELPFGAYVQDFAECNGYRVNIETKEPEFSYPDPQQPESEPVYQKPLSEQVKQMESSQAAMQEAIDFLLLGGL